MNATARDFLRHRDEVIREVKAGRFQITEGGIHLPGMGANCAGFFDVWHNGENHSIEPNLVVLTGIDQWINSGLVSGSMYLAPFSGNVAVVNTLTAATVVAAQTEFTNYDETTRQQWVKDSYTNGSGSMSNSGSKAVFTASSGGGTVWGASLTTANVKSATTGVLIACAKFGSSRVLAATDTLTLQYTITLTSS